MVEIAGLINLSTNIIPFFLSVIVLAMAYLAFEISLRVVKKKLLIRAKTKKQISNVEIFSRLVKYMFIFLLVVSAISYYTGSPTGVGLTIGLVSAALGFALQKPITGVAAWLMVVTRRPFEIGDRIIIGDFKGDVKDITLTHIYLSEVGGTVKTEDNSRRIILVPNSILFEQKIINYTQQDDFILDEVSVLVTYESNLDKAMVLALNAAKKNLKAFLEIFPREPFVRIAFEQSGVNVSVKYFVVTNKRTEIASNITKEIFDLINKEEDINIAYPHAEIIINQKTDYIKTLKGNQRTAE